MFLKNWRLMLHIFTSTHFQFNISVICIMKIYLLATLSIAYIYIYLRILSSKVYYIIVNVRSYKIDPEKNWEFKFDAKLNKIKNFFPDILILPFFAYGSAVETQTSIYNRIHIEAIFIKSVENLSCNLNFKRISEIFFYDFL